MAHNHLQLQLPGIHLILSSGLPRHLHACVQTHRFVTESKTNFKKPKGLLFFYKIACWKPGGHQSEGSSLPLCWLAQLCANVTPSWSLSLLVSFALEKCEDSEFVPSKDLLLLVFLYLYRTNFPFSYFLFVCTQTCTHTSVCHRGQRATMELVVAFCLLRSSGL